MINIASDFTQYPGGRYRRHGRGSGEEFREDWLVPALRTGSVTVEFAGAYGYPASFLEEAFGGLVREGWTTTALGEKLKLCTSDESYKVYVDQAWDYIADEGRRQARQTVTDN